MSHEFDNLRERCTRTKYMRDADFYKLRHVRVRNNAANQHADVLQAGLTQQFQYARHQSHVGAAED